MSSSMTVQQKWVQTECTSVPGFPNNSGVPSSWTDDSKRVYNGQHVDVASCDGQVPSSNAPPYPSTCWTGPAGSQGTPPFCPNGFYSCGVANTHGGQETYDGPGSGNYRICSGPDAGFCPTIPLNGGTIKAVEAVFDGQPFDGSGGTFEGWQPTRISCTYPTDAFKTPSDLSGLSPDDPSNPFYMPPRYTTSEDQAAIKQSRQDLYDSLMGQVCLQPASNLSAERYCPVIAGIQTTDCMLISANDPTGYGDACRKWCNKGGTNNSGNAACSAAMNVGCRAVVDQMGGTPDNPDGTKFLDCTCINRGSNQFFASVNYQVAVPGVNARCWFLPCNVTNAAPYLIDENTATQPCPTDFKLCQQINDLRANGDINSNQFNNYISCSSSDDGNGGGGGDNGGGGGGGGNNNNGGGTPPSSWTPSSGLPPPKKGLSFGTILGISFAVIVVILLIVASHYSRKKILSSPAPSAIRPLSPSKPSTS